MSSTDINVGDYVTWKERNYNLSHEDLERGRDPWIRLTAQVIAEEPRKYTLMTPTGKEKRGWTDSHLSLATPAEIEKFKQARREWATQLIETLKE